MMDALLTAAARALATGDPLRALQCVALRDDAPALALRGIAMAQLGELPRARELLRRAARAFEPRETLAKARCTLAEAEVALALRDFRPVRALGPAERALQAHGDRGNALHARLLSARRALLLGRVDEAERTLSDVDLTGAPPMLAAIGELARADVALRRVRPRQAQAALERARAAAIGSRIVALAAEVEQAIASLAEPAARSLSAGRERALSLEGVRALLASGALVVDACRRAVRVAKTQVSLAKNPVLFALARTLAARWPGDAPRSELIAEAFAARRPNDSHRARLRVEVGRLRRKLAALATIRATPAGFEIAPLAQRRVVVLLPPIDGNDAALLAVLSDGRAWSTSALALALGSSQRTVQRALSSLEAEGRVQALGRARARRWLAPPLVGFATHLLLPAFSPGG